MSVKSPGSVSFEDGEVERINRVQVALLLHITPVQVDEMPALDVDDVMSIKRANDEIAAWQQKQARKKKR